MKILAAIEISANGNNCRGGCIYGHGGSSPTCDLFGKLVISEQGRPRRHKRCIAGETGFSLLRDALGEIDAS